MARGAAHFQGTDDVAKPIRHHFHVYSYREITRYLGAKYGVDTAVVLPWMRETGMYPTDTPFVYLPVYEADNLDVPALVRAALHLIRRDFADDSDTLQVAML
jgi:hypothetical protein